MFIQSFKLKFAVGYLHDYFQSIFLTTISACKIAARNFAILQTRYLMIG
jgi:hypothetical protein